MADKQYLDQEGLERLVNYINAALRSKINIGDIPEGVVTEEDLVNFVTNQNLNTVLHNYALASALNDYATNASLSDVVREAALSAYATNASLQDVVRDEDLEPYATTASLSDVVRQDTLADYATAAELETLKGEVTGLYHFKGSVADLDELEAIENPKIGDTYNITDTGMNAAWTGTVWDEFGSVTDLTPYLKIKEINPIALSAVDAILYGGKSAVANDVAGINSMIANDQAEVEILVSNNLNVSTPIVIGEGKKVTLNLCGKDLDSAGTAIQVNGGEVIIKNGDITSASNPTINVTNGGSVTIENANIVSERHNGINATEGEVIVNSGSITSQEAGIAGFKDSVITINGGTITGIDNGGLMGNGSPAGSDHDGTNMNIIMNGGKIVGHIQSAGYLACGVYVPNSGSFIMNGGEIESDGCGICMRGGTVHIGANAKITATGTSGVTGKVGDSRVVVGPYAIVYDAQSKYPAVEAMELIIDNGAQLSGTDGDIDIVESTYDPNILDKRIKS